MSSIDIETKEKKNKNREYYEVEKKKDKLIGKGAFNSVYLGKADVYKIINDQKYYTKKGVLIALKELNNNYDASIFNEILISSKLSDNNNIVKMIDLIDIDNKKYIAYEYCNGGDLRQYINYFHTFDETLIQIIMNQIVNGLIEFFEKNIVHHDIKPENILLKFSDDIKNSEQFINEILKNKNNSQQNINTSDINNNSLQNNNPFQINPNSLDYNNNAMNMNIFNNINNNMIMMNNNNMNNNMNNNLMNINNNINFNINNNIYNNFSNMNNNVNQNFNIGNNNNNYFNNGQNNIINQNYNPCQFQQNNNYIQNNYFVQNNYYVQNNFNSNSSLNDINNSNDSNFIYHNSSTNNNINIVSPKNQNDIKSNNNLFSFGKFKVILKESTEYKLSDFGLSKSKADIVKRNISGSPLYMAPELFKIDSELSEIENKEVDIWALGILAYELFFGKRPFEAYSIQELSDMFEQGIYIINLKDEQGKERSISKEFFHFLNRCLQKNPEKRANIYELKNSNFLNYDISSFEQMKQIELMGYLKGLAEVDNFGNFKININVDYLKEIKKKN